MEERERLSRRFVVAYWALLIPLTQTGACGVLSVFSLLRGDCCPTLVVRGILLDADTDVAVTDAAVSGSTFTEGQVTDSVNPLTSKGIPSFPPPGEDGSFELLFATGSLTPCPPPEFPHPDQVEVVVLGGGCEQRFMIDINEETVIDIGFPDGALEFKDPIRVPGCEE